jgi:hypothetical protein
MTISFSPPTHTDPASEASAGQAAADNIFYARSTLNGHNMPSLREEKLYMRQKR